MLVIGKYRCRWRRRRVPFWRRSGSLHCRPFGMSLSLLSRKVLSERPGAVKGAPLLGAAQRTLDGEDRSETVYEEGKEGSDSIRFLKRKQAKRLHLHVATIVLSETRGL